MGDIISQRLFMHTYHFDHMSQNGALPHQG